MPDVPIVDAHLHLWDPTAFRIPWLDGIPLLDQPYDLADFRAATGPLAIDALVYLQVDVDPAYALIEVEQIAQFATIDPRLQAIVAWAPIEFGARARRYLAQIAKTSGIVRGVRRILQGEPDPQFCLHADFIAGIKLLPEFGYSFDVCVYHHQLPAVIEMVRRCPETSFVLDHMGKPAIREGRLDPWREHIAALAQFPNVTCKISGIVVEADHARWNPQELRPYIDHVIAQFGEDRVMFGGDWPVMLQASAYQRWVATLESLTANLSVSAQRKLWAENARAFYRLTKREQ